MNVDDRDKEGLKELAESLCFVDVGVVDISISNSLDNCRTVRLVNFVCVCSCRCGLLRWAIDRLTGDCVIGDKIREIARL